MQKTKQRQTTSKAEKSYAESEKKPILNDQYQVVSQLGDGKTSRVYLCQKLSDPK